MVCGEMNRITGDFGSVDYATQMEAAELPGYKKVIKNSGLWW